MVYPTVSTGCVSDDVRITKLMAVGDETGPTAGLWSRQPARATVPAVPPLRLHAIPSKASLRRTISDLLVSSVEAVAVHAKKPVPSVGARDIEGT